MVLVAQAAHPPAHPPAPSAAPVSGREIRQLVSRLRLEVGVTNALGAGVLIIGAALFDPPTGEDSGLGAAAAWSLLVVVPVVGLGIWASNRLVRPIVDWLRQDTRGRAAPDRIQRLVLAHPALEAAILMVLWGLAALGLATAEVLIGTEDPVREFLTTLVGTGVAGIVVSTLSFLAVQRVLGPWYERFFAGDDPTRHAMPSTRVRRRLVLVSVLGGAVPLLLVGAAVSDRLANPGDVGQLEGIVWFLVGAGVLAGLSLTVSVRHSITRPLEAIRRAADSVRAGDLSVRVPVEAPDELGELAVAFNAMVEGLRERRRLQDLYGRQVGDAVAGKVLEEGVTFQGERRVASVLFLDLAGFSRLGEELPPERVVELLNRVFSVVVEEVDARDGLVNKFMGDAVLAVFGAPLDDPGHARHAVEAACAVAAALEREGVGFGIGVSTGPVVAAHVGTESRFEYTVVGDAVNEAARLQELTRAREVNVLVSGATAAAMGAGDALTRLDSVSLRGRTRPTDLYVPSRPRS